MSPSQALDRQHRPGAAHDAALPAPPGHLEAVDADVVDRLVGLVTAELVALALELQVVVAANGGRSAPRGDDHTRSAGPDDLSAELEGHRRQLVPELEVAHAVATRRARTALAAWEAITAAPKARNDAELTGPSVDDAVLQTLVAPPGTERSPEATVQAAPRQLPRTGVRRFLYVDTVLPLVAVLIILLVLWAWIG